jgi:hypothetical protein
MHKAPDRTKEERIAIAAELRNRMLSLTLADLSPIEIPEERSILALAIDTGVEPDFFYTLVATIDGAVSLYFSSGGATIGLGEREPIRTLAAEVLLFAENFLLHARPVQNPEVPEPGEVIFHFVTRSGLRVYSAPEEDLGEERDNLSTLFLASHDLLSLVREYSDA